MNMNQKGFVNIALIVLIVILAGALGYVTLVKKSTPVEQTQINNTVSQNDTSGWKKYSDASLEFEYPASLSVKKEGEAVVLNHSITHKHPNPCDFKGDAPPLEKLADFGVSLTFFNKNLKDTLISEGSDYVVKNFFENSILKLSEGFIDKFKAGSLNGFQVTSGVEGCGKYTYYFPISPTKTLVVNRPFISEFNSINADYQTYLSLPGVIKPNQAEEFFVKIISSLKVK